VKYLFKYLFFLLFYRKILKLFLRKTRDELLKLKDVRFYGLQNIS